MKRHRLILGCVAALAVVAVLTCSSFAKSAPTGRKASKAAAKAPLKRSAALGVAKAKPGPTTKPAGTPAVDAAADIQEMLATRAELSAQLLGGKLSASQESSAIAKLTAIANKTLLSPKVYEGDSCAFTTTIRAGETLTAACKRSGTQVPPAFIAQINGINESRVREGQTVKMLRGPFRAVVDKHRFSLYVYLQGPDGRKVFVKRAKVAIGRNNSTPDGEFRVGGKATRAMWVPPPSMRKKFKKPILWGQKGYPLGRDGIFMSLRGIDSSTRGAKGYGIHSTNSQASIGQARSHGCIRVGDSDIKQLYAMLSEGASTVTIVP